MTPEQQLKMSQAAITGEVEASVEYMMNMMKRQYKVWHLGPNGEQLFSDANGFYLSYRGFDYRIVVEIQDPR